MLSYFADEAIQALKKQINTYKKAGKPVFILCDTHTQTHCFPLLKWYISSNFEYNTLTMPAGEGNKNIQTATALWKELLSKNANKNAVLICLGGGVVSDIGGFVGATYKRGISTVFIPTTLMAQIDACIGGKTAINLDGIKNQVGLFYQPETVFTIPAFLATLPEKEILSGFAEMLKHTLITDKTHWKKLTKIQDISKIIHSTELLKKSIDIKTAICNVDMYDMNERKKLNFGHTIGHALESFSMLVGRALTHGESVAYGMIAEAHISHQKKLLSAKELTSITAVLSRFFPPFPIEKKNYDTILSFLQKDKKKVNNRLNFTLLDSIGSAVINQQVSQNEIIQSLENLSKIKQYNYDTI